MIHQKRKQAHRLIKITLGRFTHKRISSQKAYSMISSLYILTTLFTLNFPRIIAASNKEPFGYVGSELGDYRLRGGEPFVTLYEHENFRGKIYRQPVRKDCANIARQYKDWASSIDLHGRCITLCDQRDCGGRCSHLYPNMKETAKRLSSFAMNDVSKSVKFCYKEGKQRNRVKGVGRM